MAYPNQIVKSRRNGGAKALDNAIEDAKVGAVSRQSQQAPGNVRRARCAACTSQR